MFNKFGVDVNYFKKELKRLDNNLGNYKPDELRRYFLTLADIAKSPEPVEDIIKTICHQYIGKINEPVSRNEIKMKLDLVLLGLEKAGYIKSSRQEDQKIGDSTLKINGRTFVCSCGCNVFGKYPNNAYKCNGCGEWYTGE